MTALTYQTAFELELKKLIQSRITEIVASTMNPLASPSIEQFRHNVGYVRAMNEVLDDLCEMANETLIKRET